MATIVAMAVSLSKPETTTQYWTKDLGSSGPEWASPRDPENLPQT
jgi:hypothetical protein